MPARSLQHFVLLIALVLAPICGMGGAATAAPIGAQAAEHHATMADPGHCAGMGGGEQDDRAKGDVAFDCRVACAGVLAPSPFVAETAILVSVPQRLSPVVATPGLTPTADPPPPRLS